MHKLHTQMKYNPGVKEKSVNLDKRIKINSEIRNIFLKSDCLSCIWWSKELPTTTYKRVNYYTGLFYKVFLQGYSAGLWRTCRTVPCVIQNQFEAKFWNVKRNWAMESLVSSDIYGIRWRLSYCSISRRISSLWAPNRVKLRLRITDALLISFCSRSPCQKMNEGLRVCFLSSPWHLRLPAPQIQRHHSERQIRRAHRGSAPAAGPAAHQRPVLQQQPLPRPLPVQLWRQVGLCDGETQDLRRSPNQVQALSVLCVNMNDVTTQLNILKDTPASSLWLLPRSF